MLLRLIPALLVDFTSLSHHHVAHIPHISEHAIQSELIPAH